MKVFTQRLQSFTKEMVHNGSTSAHNVMDKSKNQNQYAFIKLNNFYAVMKT